MSYHTLSEHGNLLLSLHAILVKQRPVQSVGFTRP